MNLSLGRLVTFVKLGNISELKNKKLAELQETLGKSLLWELQLTSEQSSEK